MNVSFEDVELEKLIITHKTVYLTIYRVSPNAAT